MAKARRYNQPTRPSKRRRFDPPFVTAAAPQATYPPAFIEPAGPRPRGTTAQRRGRFTIVPIGVLPILPPAFIDAAGPRPRGTTAIRRGRFYPLPPATVATVPTFIEPNSRATKPLLQRRRGAFFAISTASNTGTQVPAPVTIRQARTKPVLQRRGVFFPTYTIASNTGTQNPAPIAIRQARTKPVLQRRGAFYPTYTIASNTGTQAPPVLFTRQRVRPGLQSRGKFFPVAPPIVAQPPPWITRRAARVYRSRSGEYFSFVPAQSNTGTQALPPQYLRQDALRDRPRQRRGVFFGYPVLTTAPAPVPIPQPPSQGAGMMSMSLSRRSARARRRPILNRVGFRYG